MSWSARLDDVSDSAKLRIISRKEGIDPVVIALTRGIVTVGAVACAVKGIAEPSDIRLGKFVSYLPVAVGTVSLFLVHLCVNSKPEL